jgi:hypothetical protein
MDEPSAVEQPESAPEPRAATIQSAYDRLASYADGEAALRFEISDFKTIAVEELDRHRWADLVAIPGGRMIDTVRKTHLVGDEGRYAHYQVSWSPETPVSQDMQKQWQAATAADVLSMASQGDPNLEYVTALTSYRVTAILNGQTRAYQAAFLWLAQDAGAEGGSQTPFMVADNVTQGVQEAALEALPTKRDFEAGRVPQKEPEDVATKAVCRASSSTTFSSPHDQDSNAHVTGGFHHSDPDFQINCSCDTSCRSTCTATPYSLECYDDGGFMADACHKMGSSSDSSTVVRDNATSDGADCAAAYICGQKACAFCLCGLSVGVDVSGVNVSFSGGDASWTSRREYKRFCAPCTP